MTLAINPSLYVIGTSQTSNSTLTVTTTASTPADQPVTTRALRCRPFSLVGTTPNFQPGTVSDPASFDGDNSGWNIKDYGPQGNENKLRGVQFNVSTEGYQNILLTWERLNNARVQPLFAPAIHNQRRGLRGPQRH